MKVHFCILGLLAISCNAGQTHKNTTSPKPKKVTQEDRVSAKPTLVDTLVEDSVSLPTAANNLMKRDTLVINFDNFQVHLFDHKCYPLDDVEFVTTDTINLEEDIESTIAGKQLFITTSDSNLHFDVYSSYSQTLRVYVGEKDFEDLDEWTTTDPYVKLTDSSQFYRLPSFDQERKVDEISSDILQIAQRIRSIEGVNRSEIEDSVTSLEQLPLEFWVYRTIIKIKVSSPSGIISTKYIINNSSWGC